MQIVDNSPELALDDPLIQQILNPQQPAETVPPADVKEPVVSSATGAPALEAETPEQLKAQLRGMQAELTRRKGNAEAVDTLKEEVAELRAKLSAPAADRFAWVQKLDDDSLTSKQVDWDDELADARAKYGRAEDAGDTSLMERQGQRVLQAKETLRAFRKESMDRVTRSQQTFHEVKSTQEAARLELDSMYGAMNEAYPDFTNPESAIWKAGREEFLAHPTLMRHLGQMGEVVAAAMAVVRHPELLPKGQSAATARRDIIGKLEKGVAKALQTGATAPSTTRSTSVDVSSAEGLRNFNAMIDQVKGG
jgi:predicted  nucleic acid-binding Zn-ribbon protein